MKNSYLGEVILNGFVATFVLAAIGVILWVAVLLLIALWGVIGFWTLAILGFPIVIILLGLFVTGPRDQWEPEDPIF